MATFTVLGAGMMGSALCVPLCDRGHEVRLVGTHLDQEIVAALRSGGEHPTLRLALPSGIQAYAHDQLAEAMVGCDVLALGVSSAGVAWAREQIAPFARRDLPLFMITKGLAWDGDELAIFPDVIGEGLPVSPAAVAGPCIAGELARRVPTCVVLAGRDANVLGKIAALVETDYYHPRVSDDPIGAEVCAALKNAYAMAVAFGAGLHERAGGEPGSVAMHNYESAVFAQSLLEMRRIVVRLGGKASTVAGLAGAGDLDVTNNGGRTGRFGRLLGLGLSRDEAVEKMQGATLECLEIIAVMRKAVARWREDEPIALPLLDHMAEVVLDGAPVAVPFREMF